LAVEKLGTNFGHTSALRKVISGDVIVVAAWIIISGGYDLRFRWSFGKHLRFHRLGGARDLL
jgi:hypothetical protein